MKCAKGNCRGLWWRCKRYPRSGAGRLSWLIRSSWWHTSKILFQVTPEDFVQLSETKGVLAAVFVNKKDIKIPSRLSSKASLRTYTWKGITRYWIVFSTEFRVHYIIMGSGTNIGSRANISKKKFKSKLNLNTLDLFFSTKLDLEGVPYISASDIDKVLECHDENTNKKAAAALNTLVIKETKIGQEDKGSFIGEKKGSAAKVVRKEQLRDSNIIEKGLTTLPKDTTQRRSERFRRDVTMAEMHGNSKKRTLPGCDIKRQKTNGKGHKKTTGRKRNASVETVCKRRSSEGPSRRDTHKRAKSAESALIKENIEPRYLEKANESIMVRKAKCDSFNGRATSRKKRWSSKQYDEHSDSETRNLSQNDQNNKKTQSLASKSSLVTAKPGTLKYFKQRQNVLETLASDLRAEDDFFSNPEASTSQNMSIYDDSDDSLTIKTPVGKAKRHNVPPNITPRTALIGQHCTVTPTSREKESPKPFTKDKICVLHEIYHLQEMKKKGKWKKENKEDPKLNVTPLEFPKFEDKQVDEENHDDYFDESV